MSSFPIQPAAAEDGYDLWLRYRPIVDGTRRAQLQSALRSVCLPGSDATTDLIRQELQRALPVLCAVPISFVDKLPAQNTLLIATVAELAGMDLIVAPAKVAQLGRDGFLLRTIHHRGQQHTLITANRSVALLTGIFHLLRLVQTGQPLDQLDLISVPRIQLRLLAHWDNLDGSIERGYAGRSLWQWDELPATLDPRYQDYARACASLGLNGTCLNNVNANPKSLTLPYLEKAAALADLFRPYGIKVYLAPVFSAPMQLGGLPTADPRDPAVAAWWRAKVAEIYQLIPDFGGFQIKANSEGQPGPRDYGANHAEGACVLAEALQPYGGTLLWRAFVYDVTIDEDRAKCANLEFEPLDGHFLDNTLVQVKSGPVDYQPREPFHPLFGAMPQTPIALEMQIAQEYFGQARHLVYLGEMWQEVLDSDTFARGPDSTVARVVDGTLFGHNRSAMVGVANSGDDRNWCGHHFSQANWYAFGRLAWDHTLRADAIADEWIRLTWTDDDPTVATIKGLMLASWPACIDYMTPLGLHHLMQEGHHYGPDPGFDGAWRRDWNNTYYHRADRAGLGYDRSSRGSNATAQYHSPLREQFDELTTCPEQYLLWFHHVAWNHRLASGRTLWAELQARYHAGVCTVEEMAATWATLADQIDPQRHADVAARLAHQVENAREWRAVCLAYFAQFAEVAPI
jgi:alpha-glucuronidase